MIAPGIPVLQNIAPLMPILDAIKDGLLIVDASGMVVAINKTMRQFYQGAEVPFPGYPLSDFNPDDWVEVKRVLASGQPQYGLPMVLPAASVLADRTPLAQHGKTVGVVCSMREIDRLDAMAHHLNAFQNLNSLADDIIETAPSALLVADAQGVIIRVNEKFASFCASEREMLMGRELHTLACEAATGASSGMAAIRDMILASLKTGQGMKQAYAETSRPVMLETVPVLKEQGTVRLVVASIQPLDAAEPAHRHEREAEPDFTIAVQSEEMDESISALLQECGIVTRSKSMLQVVQRAAKVSQSESSVLLQGESGVGKSMLAAFIHRLSQRAGEKFVSINCGAIPEQLMESELFGYERGAFTGAAPRGKIGHIESANGGTVFFDEVAELSMAMQVKLLEVIDKKVFFRVGGTRQIKVDFRIIAATNRDLQREVAEGRFRHDLFYRLNVIPIVIPPLKQRKEDIMALALNMLTRYNASRPVRKRLSPEVMRLLLLYDFPGNARELNNAMEWMLVMGEGDILHPKDMPIAFQMNSDTGVHAPDTESDRRFLGEDILSLGGNRPLKDTVHAFEKRCLEQALAQHENMQAAARSLGMHPTTLWRKLTQHNLLDHGKKE